MNHRFFDKLSGILGDKKLTFVGWIILRYSYLNKGKKLSMNKFAQKTGVTFAHISNTMRSLSEQNLVKMDEKNGRTKDYNITKEGIALLNAVHELTNPEVEIDGKIFS